MRQPDERRRLSRAGLTLERTRLIGAGERHAALPCSGAQAAGRVLVFTERTMQSAMRSASSSASARRCPPVAQRQHHRLQAETKRGRRRRRSDRRGSCAAHRQPSHGSAVRSWQGWRLCRLRHGQGGALRAAAGRGALRRLLAGAGPDRASCGAANSARGPVRNGDGGGRRRAAAERS